MLQFHNLESTPQEHSTLRRLNLAGACLLAMALMAGCTGGGDEPRKVGVSASCEKIAALESYRYSIVVKLQAPAFQETPGATPGAPLGEFADTLTALLSDFQISGAHVAPDRTQAILQFQEDEVELRAIGDRRWERFGATWEEQEAGSPDIGFLTPAVVCTDVVLEIAGGLDGSMTESEIVNGLETNRYTLDKADLSQLPELLGAAPGTELPDEFKVDVWLAKDGEWPVKLDINAEDTDEQGNPISMNLFMELRDVNDRGISIEAPEASAPTG